MSKKAKQAVAVAETLGIEEVMRSATKEAEKSTKLNSVFLRSSGLAATTTGTGSLMIDWIMGGGVPPGRIVGISGPEHSGKSFIGTEIMNQQLLARRYVDFQDAEGTTDPLWLLSRGIDFDKYRGKRNKNAELLPGEVDKFMYHQPSSGDQIMHFIHGICQKLPENRQSNLPPPVLWLLDSVVALVSDAVTEDIDANRMAMHAKMYAENLPIINSSLSRSGCSLVYVNQMRSRPGVSFGSPEYEPCGSALQFFSSIRLNLSRSKPKTLSADDHPLVESTFAPGNWKEGGVYQEPSLSNPGFLDRSIFTAVKTIKNKVYKPRKVCWIKINFERGNETGKGLDAAFDVFSFLFENDGLVKGSRTKEGTSAQVQVYKTQPMYGVDLTTLGIPASFTYDEWRGFVDATPGLYQKLRNEFISSDLVYTNEPALQGGTDADGKTG